MAKIDPIAFGRVQTLCLDGEPVHEIKFSPAGPVGDRHAGFRRRLSGHDGGYLKTSELKKGHKVFNWRSWTALSKEELEMVMMELGRIIPQGCLLENFTVIGIPGFSQLPPTTRLVFPERNGSQAVLAVWEENGPCHGVGKRLEAYYNQPKLSNRFIVAAQHRRGVVGFVLAPGYVEINDEVKVYPPV